jgi:hypothetical protein
MEYNQKGHALPCGGERSYLLLQSQCHLAAQLCKTCKKEKKRKGIGEIVIQSLFETWARKD